MKPVKSLQGKITNNKVLQNVFPEEYINIMSTRAKALFLGAFSKVLKHYPDKTPYGYRAKEDKRLYPKLKDIGRPYRLCKLQNLKAVILAVEPYNNGEATGIPFQFSMNYRPDFQLPAKQQDVDAVDYAVRSNFSTYKTIKVPKYNKDGSLSKRKGKEVVGDLVHGVDWNYLAEQGVLVIHASLTSEEKNTYRHLKIWLDFTIEFLRCLFDYNDKVVLLTIGSVFREMLNPDSIMSADNIEFLKGKQVIKAPDAYFDERHKEALKHFQPFMRLNRALKRVDQQPISFINKTEEDDKQDTESILPQG